MWNTFKKLDEFVQAMITIVVITIGLGIYLMITSIPLDAKVEKDIFASKHSRITNTNGLDRFVDDEAGVVCYTYWNRAVSCIPISQTKLRFGKEEEDDLQ